MLSAELDNLARLALTPESRTHLRALADRARTLERQRDDLSHALGRALLFLPPEGESARLALLALATVPGPMPGDFQALRDALQAVLQGLPGAHAHARQLLERLQP